MRRSLAWISGAAGGFALIRLLKGRRPAAASEPSYDPRAAELREKLAESRAVVGERDAFEEGETPVDRAEDTAGDLDARRRAVHEAGRAAAERMRPPATPE